MFWKIQPRIFFVLRMLCIFTKKKKKSKESPLCIITFVDNDWDKDWFIQVLYIQKKCKWNMHVPSITAAISFAVKVRACIYPARCSLPEFLFIYIFLAFEFETAINFFKHLFFKNINPTWLNCIQYIPVAVESQLRSSSFHLTLRYPVVVIFESTSLTSLIPAIHKLTCSCSDWPWFTMGRTLLE